MAKKLLISTLVLASLSLIFMEREAVGHFLGGDKSAKEAVNDRGGNRNDTKRIREVKTAPQKRKQQLQDLLRKWEQTEPLDNPKAQSPQRDALIKVAVETLLCSPELVTFIGNLDEKGYPSHRETINLTVAALLRSDRADEVRTSLISLVAFNGDQNTPTDNIFRNWVKEAGKTASAAQVEEFCDKLSTDRSKLDALGSFNSELAKTKPYEAVVSTLEKLQVWEFSGSIETSLQDQVASLPPTADFASIEKLVPQQLGANLRRDEALDLMKSLIFQKWAEKDPAGAANHIMENQDRIPPKYLATIAQKVCSRNLDGALEWVQTFPDGKYYDAAVGGIVLQLSQIYPNEAAELARRISDPELREKRIAELQRIGVIK